MNGHDGDHTPGLREGDPLNELFAVAIVRSDDEAGTIVSVNTKLNELAGYEHEELLGKPLDVLIPQVSRAAHRHYRAGFMLRPSVRPMGGPGREVVLAHRSGRQIQVLIGLAPINEHDVTAVIMPIDPSRPFGSGQHDAPPDF